MDTSTAKKHPEVAIDREFLPSTIPSIRKLVEAFGAAGRPVVYLKHVVRPDYVDACFPYWRTSPDMDPIETQFIVEGTWGAEIVDELNPAPRELVVVKKGLNGFHRTPLETDPSQPGRDDPRDDRSDHHRLRQFHHQGRSGAQLPDDARE